MSALILKLPSLIFHLSAARWMTHCAAGRRVLSCLGTAPPQGASVTCAHKGPQAQRTCRLPAELFTPQPTSPTMLSTALEMTLFNVPKREDLYPRKKERSEEGPIKPHLGRACGVHRGVSSSSPSCCRNRLVQSSHRTIPYNSCFRVLKSYVSWSNLKSSNPTWWSLVLNRSYHWKIE